MPKKNDLSVFKTAAPIAEQPTAILAPKARGRKAKPESEKESEIIAIKFTKSELAMIEEKAGLVPKSTYLKHLIRTKTDIFK
jgi:hypothetical protein